MCRVRGRSPAEGDLAVYALLPRLLPPGSLSRLALMLSADPSFEAEEEWVEELPVPAWGHAVVGLRGKPVFVSAVREEVKRMLEEYRAR